MRDRSPPAIPAAASPIGMTGESWLLLGLLGTLWGSGYMLSATAVRDIPPATTVLMRVVLASAILFVLLRRRGIALPSGWRAWRPFFVLGLFNTAIPFTLSAWSMTRIESSLAGILTATVPIFTIIVAHLAASDERLTGAKVLGIGIGMAGIVAIFGLDADALAGGSGVAKLAIIGASLLYGINAVFARTLKGTPPMLLAFGQLATSAIVLAPWVLIVDQPFQTATWTRDALLSVLVLGVFGSAVAYLIFYRLLMTTGATATSLVTYVIPVVAVLMGTLFLDERLRAQHLIGMALILAGLAVLDGRLTRWLMGARTVRAAAD